jgi:hypothetical protein
VREIAQSSANQFPVAGCAEVTAGDHAGWLWAMTVRSACHNALIRGLGLRLARRRRTTIGRQRATQST